MKCLIIFVFIFNLSLSNFKAQNPSFQSAKMIGGSLNDDIIELQQGVYFIIGKTLNLNYYTIKLNHVVE